MRKFLRHPSDMPVELVVRKQSLISGQRLHNISLGGGACNSPRRFRRGTAVELRVPLLGDQARCPGVIAWCKSQNGGYRVGIAFIDEDSLFRARMIEQICQIQRYHDQLERESGESHSIEQCARQWIATNAADYPH
ncbi:PilZ domain-containing protein [Pseudomonas sp. NCCP-436]|uniref:PilZ domain-containing protein n=1 Tax=Pseudomonas sp. NCCP-436 TaxID=2842481 RepID=UPI001C80B7A8|nr:PilZ domain-containing protein [Pseudomonas sp. NCCP-436]GIZ11770.1 hypothetical protein NCCP436_11860 [Pseudomonas sp. NCCP-436]